MLAAKLVHQLPRRSDGDALRRHDGEVEALGQLHRLEQRHEAFLLDEQDGAEAIARATGREGGLGQVEIHLVIRLVIAHGGEVAAHVQRPEPDRVIVVRLAEVAAIVIDHVPVDARFLDVVGQELLGEILVEAAAERLVGALFDVGPRRIHDLPRIGRQGVVGRCLHVGRLHRPPGRVANGDMGAVRSSRSRGSAAPRPGAPRPCAASPISW